MKKIGSKIVKPVGGKDSTPWGAQNKTYEQWKKDTAAAAAENKKKFEIEHAKRVLHNAGISNG